MFVFPKRIRESVRLLVDVMDRARDPGILQAVLFGSYARGDYRADSDVDVLVLVERRTSELLDALYDAVLEAQLRHGAHLSLKVVPRWAWDRMAARGEPIAEAVEREGKVLWTPKPEAASAAI